MHRLLILLGAISIVFMSVDASALDCDSLAVDVTAEITNDAGFEGMYKYTITGYWEVSGAEQGEGLSNLLFSLGGECPCVCDAQSPAVLFPNPAGTSTGLDGDDNPCQVVYQAFVECNGLEDITDDVVLKYEVPDNQDCEPIAMGSGVWIFYSTLEPLAANVYPNGAFIKFGETICNGPMSGQLPSCHECLPVSTEQKSWGSIKAKFD